MRRFGFNPMLQRPVIAGVAPEVSLIPVPHLLVRKASPLGVYFAGMEKWKVAFSQDVGTFFEAYVGRQLKLSGGEVRSAAKYVKSGAEAETVDWTVAFDDVVFLVEVKSVRPTEAVRVGDPGAPTELTRMLGKAIGQVNTSAAMVRERHPALSHVPDDRPMVGLVVTLEPFHTVNSPRSRRGCPPPTCRCRCARSPSWSTSCKSMTRAWGRRCCVLPTIRTRRAGPSGTRLGVTAMAETQCSTRGIRRCPCRMMTDARMSPPEQTWRQAGGYSLVRQGGFDDCLDTSTDGSRGG